LKGFTRGYQGMLLRDGPGFGLYFTLFEAVKRRLGVSDKDRQHNQYNGLNNTQVAMRQFLAGGFSGAITWTFSFPFDTIKTRMQAESGATRSNVF
jgi:solute carrier family 25 carnitine/acylcarnitine transporter 20/29